MRNRLSCLVAVSLCLGALTAADPLDPVHPTGLTIRGIECVSWWHDEYLGGEADAAFADLAATSASWAAVLVTWYMADPTDSAIVPYTASSGPEPKTPSDAAVRHAIRDLKAQGLRVMLNPMIGIWSGEWRAVAAPEDPVAWFQAYRDFLVHYAVIAQDEGADLFCVGSEMISLSGSAHRSRWVEVITAVREEYAGPLTYGANCNRIGDEYAGVSFWDQVDVAGLDIYHGLSSKSQPTVQELVTAWKTDGLLADLRVWAETIGKPVVATEIGYQSRRFCAKTPYGTDGLDDAESQRRAVQAAYEVFADESAWFLGMFWWGWIMPATPSYDPDDFTLRGKSAGSQATAWHQADDAVSRRITLQVSGSSVALQAVADGWLPGTPDGARWVWGRLPPRRHALRLASESIPTVGN